MFFEETLFDMVEKIEITVLGLFSTGKRTAKCIDNKALSR